MKKKIVTIALATLLLFALNSINVFASPMEESLDVPQFYFTDTDGNVTEIVDFEYVDSYYVGAQALNNMRAASFDNPDPSSNYHDLGTGEYLKRFETSSSTYEMDKWFHADSNGTMHISAYVGDAEGKLNLYTYRQNEDEIWHIRMYTLQLHQYNTRARYYNGYIRTLDDSGEKYYTTAAEATSGSFGFGVLKASWEEIDDLYDYDSH